MIDQATQQDEDIEFRPFRESGVQHTEVEWID
jgi:hypothetical protein